MASVDLFKTCIACRQGKSGHRVNSKIRKSTMTVLEMLKIVWKFNGELDPMSGICHECFESLSKVGSAYVNYLKKKEEFMCNGDLSYIMSMAATCSRQISANTSVQVQIVKNDQSSQTCATKRKLKSTPIKLKIKKALVTGRSRKPYQNALVFAIKKEMRILIDSKVFQKDPKREGNDIEDLQRSLTKLLRESAPTINATLSGLCSKPLKKAVLSNTMLTILSVAAASSNKNCIRLQKTIGLILWKTKASIRTYGILKQMGICASYRCMEKLIDRLVCDYDQPMAEWKKKVLTLLEAKNPSSSLPSDESGQAEPLNYAVTGEESLCVDISTLTVSGEKKRKSDLSPSKSGIAPTRKKLKKRLLETFNEAEEDERANILANDSEYEDLIPLDDLNEAIDEFHDDGSKKPDMITGMSITFDNVNKQGKPHGYSSQSDIKIINVVGAVAIFNRIPIDVKEYVDLSVRKALDIPIEAFLLTRSDEGVIYNDHVVVVKSILSDSLSFFQRLKPLEQVSSSRHSEYSRLKTTAINLGILPFDETSNDGMIHIMQKLQSYTPQDKNGKLFPIVVRGDGLTAERQRTAQLIRLNSITEEGKISAIFPTVSDWHKRLLLFEDDLKQLFRSPELTRGTGSLPQLRAMFGHRQAGMDVKKKFNETYEMYRFCLHSYVTAFGTLELRKMTLDDTMPNADDFSSDDLMRIFHDIAIKAVNFSWHSIGKAGQQTEYCFCGELYSPDNPRKFIACDNLECLISWYHISCLEHHVKEFNSRREAPKYHSPPKKLKNLWFCSESCEKKWNDKVCRYSADFMFSALQHESFRRAIRYNEGEKIAIYNKCHLIQFSQGNHPKYFKLVARMLMYLNGAAPKSVIHEMLHNSTVNMVGKPGHNIEVDLFNEFVVGYLKDHVLNLNNQTEKSMERRSKAFGVIEDIRNEFESFVFKSENRHKAGKNYEKWRVDLQESVDALMANNVFNIVGNRCHEGFERLSLKHVYISNITEFKKLVVKNCKEFDTANRCRDSIFSNL